MSYRQQEPLFYIVKGAT